MTGKRKLITGLVGGGFLLVGYVFAAFSAGAREAFTAYSVAVVGIVGAVIAGNVAAKFGGGAPPATPPSEPTP